VLQAEKVEVVLETTGAGDAFRAGLIGGMIKGLSMKESLNAALSLGAKSVQLPAPQPSFN
jgi:sugar/nucleoside kinase (ribokinase family)